MHFINIADGQFTTLMAVDFQVNHLFHQSSIE